MVDIDAQVTIPEDELTFTTSRSGGPGGQHVNKTATRVTLEFDVRQSPSLTDPQRHRILTQLSARIIGEGILRITADDERSQLMNRRRAVERFAALLRGALKPRAPRRPTRPTRGSKERRLKAKQRRSDVKKGRGRKNWD